MIDVHSRRLLGWSMADHMRVELVTDALKAAVRIRGGRVDDVIFHSDHGAQYGSKAFADACHRAGIRRSMGAVGTSADNAAAESFFASLKGEILPDRRSWPTEPAARLAVFHWFGFYNHRRRHSTIGYLGGQGDPCLAGFKRAVVEHGADLGIDVGSSNVSPGQEGSRRSRSEGWWSRRSAPSCSTADSCGTTRRCRSVRRR